MARLAIAKAFLGEYAKLDTDVQRAVDAAIATFARHPHPGQHLEKPRHSRDDRIRLMPVDSRWRGVVLAPATAPTSADQSDRRPEPRHILPGHRPPAGQGGRLRR